MKKNSSVDKIKVVTVGIVGKKAKRKGHRLVYYDSKPELPRMNDRG